jgi:NAD(P)H dehydrogenase (quinone)
VVWGATPGKLLPKTSSGCLSEWLEIGGGAVLRVVFAGAGTWPRICTVIHMGYPFEYVITRPEPKPRHVLVLYAHPVEDSFHASLHRTVVETLRDVGHVVDDCDLYLEEFSPVLTRQERLDYHDLETNQNNVKPYVDRLLAADALVVVHPVWIYGFPAILKGFFDRVLIPGVMFDHIDGRVKMKLHNIRKLAGVVTYGGTRSRAFLAGDPPRRNIKRVLRAMVHPTAECRYLAQYAVDLTDFRAREQFLAKVQREMEVF